MIISGRTIVTEPGKPVALAVDGRTVFHLIIFADEANTNTTIIAVGDKNVSQVSGNHSGLPLRTNEHYPIPTDFIDLSEIYIDSSAADEGVRWVAHDQE